MGNWLTKIRESFNSIGKKDDQGGSTISSIQAPTESANPPDPVEHFLKVLKLARPDQPIDPMAVAEALWLRSLMEADRPETIISTKTTHTDKPGEAKPDSPPTDQNENSSDSSIQGGAQLFTSQTTSGDESFTPASKLLLPTATALPNALAIGRAFKPLSIKANSTIWGGIDEDATVNASAESGCLIPVRKFQIEPWFSVAIVLEETPEMMAWQQTALELQQMLQQNSAFSQVRFFKLRKSSEQKTPFSLIDEAGKRINPFSLTIRGRRQLILLLTDGVAKSWNQLGIKELLASWCKNNVVALVQMFGQSLWPRTNLGDVSSLMSSSYPGNPNSQLLFPPPWWRENPTSPVATLPMFSLDPQQIGEWTKMLMHPGEEAQGKLFDCSTRNDDDNYKTSPDKIILPQERIHNFYALASNEAYRLSIGLSFLPITLPIIRLAQIVINRTPNQEQIAEFLQSGLLKPLPADKYQDIHPNEIIYEFKAGVAEILRPKINMNVLVDLIRAIGHEISQRTSGRFNQFSLVPDKDGKERLPEFARAFAEILPAGLKQIGCSHLIGLSPSDNIFTFTTVTLDQRGKEIERQQLQANQFIEELAPDINLEMVSIPGGTFMMGSPEKEEDRSDDETQHKVTVSPFYMGKFTITQEQWRVIAADKTLKVARNLESDPAHFKGKPDSAQRPVEQVSWEDAEEFCARLAKKTGRAYRLPTEAEWEYACRAGTTTPFSFGETITPDIVNYDGNNPYAEAPKGKYRSETIPVGSLGVANAFGLFDMHGNVWEWCQDWYGEDEGKDLIDPTGPKKGEYRVLRGGSWSNLGLNCRSAHRSLNPPSVRDYGNGFRVVALERTS